MSKKSAYFDQEKCDYEVRTESQRMRISFEGFDYQFDIYPRKNGYVLKDVETGKTYFCHQGNSGPVINGKSLNLTSRLARQVAGDQDGEDKLTTPMPGKIIKVFVSPGKSVKKGEKLYAMEAMKMEHTILAPFDATIESVDYQEGDQVEANVSVVQINQIKKTDD